jgi:hypothetical protein
MQQLLRLFVGINCELAGSQNARTTVYDEAKTERLNMLHLLALLRGSAQQTSQIPKNLQDWRTVVVILAWITAGMFIAEFLLAMVRVGAGAAAL